MSKSRLGQILENPFPLAFMTDHRSEELEMESSYIMLKGKLEFLDILNESLLIPFNSISFIIFTSLVSLPLFCFLVFYEIILQKTFLETSKVLGQSHNYYYGYWLSDDWPQVPFYNTKRLTRILSPRLIQLCLLYLVPYHLLELFITTTVVDLASKLYAEKKQVSLRELIRRPINKTRLKGPFITSAYVLFLSTCTLLGLMWVVTNCYILSNGFETLEYYGGHDFFVKMLIYVFHGAAFTVLLMKYMEWSAGWNMNVVISILEDAYGSEAFELSAYFSRGSSKQQGLFLMLVFFAWGLILRLPCLFGGCYQKMGGIVFTFVYISLICTGHVMKWVVCVVYFFHCKKQTLEKKIEKKLEKK